MLKQPDIQKIRSLFAEGYNLRQITEITGFSRNTVRRYIRSEEEKMPQRALIEHTDLIRDIFYSEDGNCQRVLAKLEKQDFHVHPRTLRRFCSAFREDFKRARDRERRRLKEKMALVPRQGRAVAAVQMQRMGELYLRGYNVSVISRKTGHCTTTVRKYLKEGGYWKKENSVRLDEYRDWIFNNMLKVNGNFAELHRLFEKTFGVTVNERTFRRRSIQLREEEIQKKEKIFLAGGHPDDANAED